MLTTRHGVRPLGAPDLDAFLALAGRDPVVNVFADYRARTTTLEPRWLGGEMWGRFEAGGWSRPATSARTWSPCSAAPTTPARSPSGR